MAAPNVLIIGLIPAHTFALDVRLKFRKVRIEV